MPKSVNVGAGASAVSKFAVKKDGTVHPAAQGTILKLLSVQRPVVLAYLRQVRRQHPDATPEEFVRILEKQYLWVATGGGAAVGATAVVPGLGTGAALVLATAETAGFLEGSALFAQAVAEVHGIAVSDPQRANVLVMGVMLGKAGTDLIKEYGARAGGQVQPGATGWGAMVATQIPHAMLNKLTKQLKRTMTKRYAGKQGASLLGKAMPFGIGAVIGGATNRALAKSVIRHGQKAFGPAPQRLPEYLEPRPGDVKTERQDRDLLRGLKHVIGLLKQRNRKVEGDSADLIVAGEIAEEPESAEHKSTDPRFPDVRA